VIKEYGEHLHERPGPIDAALRKLEELQPKDAHLRPAPTTIVEFGSPADRILQTATEQEIDLVVLGVRGKHIEASTHFPWATAHRVVARANCPVLTVPAQEYLW
jgi:nucleotide-binding universal stress UspA family protein